MSGNRNYYNNRNQSRNSYERVNIKYVPPSRHAIFIRGLPHNIEADKIKSFFEEETNSAVQVDFSSVNDELKRLSIALRFDSHDIAREVLMKFNQKELFGHRVEITWFKDLKKARDRMMDEKLERQQRYQSNKRRDNYQEESGEDVESDNERRGHSSGEASHSSEDGQIEDNNDGGPGEFHSLKYDVDIDRSDGDLVRDDSGNDDKKRRKKKRKRKHHTSNSDDGDLVNNNMNSIPLKHSKINISLADDDAGSFTAIAADHNNWREAVSDTEDLIDRNTLLSKTNAMSTLTENESLNTDKNLKLMKSKVESLEKAYKRDSETYSSVVNVMIRCIMSCRCV